MKRTLFLSLLLTVLTALAVGQGQPPRQNVNNLYSTTKTTSLSAAAEVLTLQNSTTSNKNTTFLSLYGYCSVACTLTVERAGVFTSGTSNTVVKVNPVTTPASGLTATNTTVISTVNTINTYNLTAGGWVSIDGTVFNFSPGAADNLTIRTSSITGTVVLQALWQEF